MQIEVYKEVHNGKNSSGTPVAEEASCFPREKLPTVRRILAVLILLTLVFIWGHSFMGREDSANESDWVRQLVTPLLELFVGSGNVTDHLVRKLAHFCEYALLGAELLGFFCADPSGRFSVCRCRPCETPGSAPDFTTSANLSVPAPTASANLSAPNPAAPANLPAPDPAAPANLSALNPAAPANLSAPNPTTPANLSAPDPADPANLSAPDPAAPANPSLPNSAAPANLSAPDPVAPASLPDRFSPVLRSEAPLLSGRFALALLSEAHVMFTAMTDETIQIFSGRGSQLQDVWLDNAGGLAGILFALAVFALISKRYSHSHTDH